MAKRPDYWLQIFLMMSKSEHLHLGYCADPDQEFVSNRDLRHAQEQYLELCLNTVPKEVQSILDVGCGTGEMLKRLTDRGLQGKGMVPDPLLAQKICTKIDPKNVILSKFEDYDDIGTTFDMVMFMESFGYIRDMKATLAKSVSLLNPKGYILICDFFAKKRDKKDLISKNFHNREDFVATITQNTDIDLVLRKDITPNTLPTIRFCNSMIFDYVLPISKVVGTSLIDSPTFKKKPYLLKLLNFIYRKTLKQKYDYNIERLNQIKPEHYLQSCAYELFLFQKRH